MLLLSDIVVKVFRFFNRTFLTDLQQFSRGLRGTIDSICPEYPLHWLELLHIDIAPNGRCATYLKVGQSATYRRISQANNVTLAAPQIADCLRHVYVCQCDIGRLGETYTMRQAEWMCLTESLCHVHVEALVLRTLTLTRLEDEALSRLLLGPQ